MLVKSETVRVVTIKCPPPAVDGVTEDTLKVGDVFEVSPNVAILLTAARWVRIETRTRARRKDVEVVAGPSERRVVSDRRLAAHRSAS